MRLVKIGGQATGYSVLASIGEHCAQSSDSGSLCEKYVPEWAEAKEHWKQAKDGRKLTISCTSMKTVAYA